MRIRLATGALALVGILLCSVPVAAKPPDVRARASVLIDGDTGQILFQQNARNMNYPASTTKLLTALVAVEHGHLDQIITVSAQAIDQPPGSSACYVSQGERQRLEYLLYGLLLVSGNDCASAIAEGLTDGNPQLFMDWMNETAKRLGATNSHFTNPHGLHDAKHYTTALDLVRIARGALANPVVRRIAGTRDFNWPGKNNGTYYNHNAMVFTYDGTIGGKTGFTEQAKLNLVSAAARDGRYVIGVVMGEENRVVQYEDMAALLDHGFSDFEQKVAVPAGAPVGNVAVISGQEDWVAAIVQNEIKVTVPKGADANVITTPKLETNIAAPVAAGRSLGVIEVRQDDQVIAAAPLVAQAAVEVKPPILLHASRWARTGLTGLLYVAAGLLGVRVTVKTLRRILRGRQRRRRRLRATGTGDSTVAGYRLPE